MTKYLIHVMLGLLIILTILLIQHNMIWPERSWQMKTILEVVAVFIIATLFVLTLTKAPAQSQVDFMWATHSEAVCISEQMIIDEVGEQFPLIFHLTGDEVQKFLIMMPPLPGDTSITDIKTIQIWLVGDGVTKVMLFGQDECLVTKGGFPLTLIQQFIPQVKD